MRYHRSILYDKPYINLQRVLKGLNSTFTSSLHYDIGEGKKRFRGAHRTRDQSNPIHFRWISYQFNHRCYYCGTKVTYDTVLSTKATKDHYIPRSVVSKFESPWDVYRNNCVGNVVLACYNCNQSKASFLPEDFRKKFFEGRSFYGETAGYVPI